MKTLLALLFVVSIPLSAQAYLRCNHVFDNYQMYKSSNLFFSQNFIGKAWAKKKLRDLKNEFRTWKKANPKGSKEEFVAEKTKAKPLEAYYDINGALRLNDRHHSLYVYTIFLAGKSFHSRVKVVKDYRLHNPETGVKWTAEQMMADIQKNHYANFDTLMKPTFEDLINLPQYITSLPDSPLRSEVSFMLANFEVPMKGSDFTPTIQFTIGLMMLGRGIEPFMYRPHSQKNIDHLTKEFLSRKRLVLFLLNNLKPSLKSERRDEIRDFLMSQI